MRMQQKSGKARESAWVCVGVAVQIRTGIWVYSVSWEGFARVCRNAPEMPYRPRKAHRSETWVGKDIQGCIVGQEESTEVHKRCHTGSDAMQFGNVHGNVQEMPQRLGGMHKSVAQVRNGAQEFSMDQERCMGFMGLSERSCMGQGGQAEV